MEEGFKIFVRWKVPVRECNVFSYDFVSQDRMVTIQKSNLKTFDIIKRSLLRYGADAMNITEVQLIKPRIFIPAY